MLTPHQVKARRQMWKLHRAGSTQCEIAAAFGISQQHVSHVLRAIRRARAAHSP